MTMRNSQTTIVSISRIWKISLLAVLVPIIGAVVTLWILESPSRILRHALNLERLPGSLTRLRMGSDVWTDEVRCFYFEIAPSDFPALLVGREFHSADFGGSFETRTIHISPPVSFIGHWRFMWETTGASCEINTNEERTRVIAVFSAH
jgi:hypothetical protein